MLENILYDSVTGSHLNLEIHTEDVYTITAELSISLLNETLYKLYVSYPTAFKGTDFLLSHVSCGILKDKVKYPFKVQSRYNGAVYVRPNCPILITN